MEPVFAPAMKTLIGCISMFGKGGYGRRYKNSIPVFTEGRVAANHERFPVLFLLRKSTLLDYSKSCPGVDGIGCIAFTVGRNHFQLYTNCRQLKSACCLLTPFHCRPVFTWRIAVGQGGDNVNNGEKKDSCSCSRIRYLF
jgi:hypothetical protein